jgi:hypothetical protein
VGRFLGRELTALPHWLAMIRYVRWPVTSGLDKPFVLRIGHRMHGQHVGWEIH